LVSPLSNIIFPRLSSLLPYCDLSQTSPSFAHSNRQSTRSGEHRSPRASGFPLSSPDPPTTTTARLTWANSSSSTCTTPPSSVRTRIPDGDTAARQWPRHGLFPEVHRRRMQLWRRIHRRGLYHVAAAQGNQAGSSSRLTLPLLVFSSPARIPCSQIAFMEDDS